MKIAIAGIGYVGLSLAVLLSQNNEVWAYDINKEKVKSIANRISPIKDPEIEDFLKTKKLHLKTTTDYRAAFSGADYIIIATPTDYDNTKNYFDTSSVDKTIKNIISMNASNVSIVIKSTVPVGFTKEVRKKYNTNQIFFSPEFLREGKALYDNLHPSRIIVGEKTKAAKKFAKLLLDNSLEPKTTVILTNPTEAEAIKLFSNTYLAMRIAFFNELDTYAEIKNLNTAEIINGVCSDPRIGNYYNNPSFGYGGYCLPKDSKQLLANYSGIPQNIISAIVDANKSRKEYIANMISKNSNHTVGIYRLAMKSGSDNFRSSAILDIAKSLRKHKIRVIIFEPTIKSSNYEGFPIESDLSKFKTSSDIILANRLSKELKDVKAKTYTRDIFNRD